MKKVLSLILSLAIAASMLAVGTISAYAFTVTDASMGTFTVSTAGALSKFVPAAGVTDIVVPSSFESGGTVYPLKSISSSTAFSGAKATMTSITFEDSADPDISVKFSCNFNGYTKLETVDLPNSVSQLPANAFKGCTALTSVDASGCSKLVAIPATAFDGCTALERVDASGCTEITAVNSKAFNGCTALTDVDLTGATKLDRIAVNAFDGCTALSTLEVENTITEIQNYAFRDCSSLDFGFLTEQPLESVGQYSFAGTSITNAVFKGSPINTLTFAADCFSGTPLESITITDAKDVTFNQNSFRDCVTLTDINVPMLKIVAANALSGCTGLTEIDFSNTILTSIGNEAFKDDINLTSITFPETLSSIGSGAFRNTGISELIMPATVTSMNGSLSGMDNLTKVTLGDVTGTSFVNICGGTVNESVMDVTILAGNIANYAFQNCDKLTSIKIGDGVKVIGANAFDGCDTNVAIDLGVNANVTSIGADAFKGINLTSFTMPAKTTSMTNSLLGHTETAELTIGSASNFTSISDVFGTTDTSALKTINVSGGTVSGDQLAGTTLDTVVLSDGVAKINSDAFTSTTIKSLFIYFDVCDIASDLAIDPSTVIYGYTGSSADEFAEAKGMQFVDINCYFNGHQWVNGVTVNATCTADGSTQKVCSVCGEVMAQSTIPAIGHHDFGTKGDLHYCTVCSAVNPSYVDTDITGNFVAPVVKTVSIPATKVKKLTAKDNGFKVTWYKKSVRGYQISYSTSSKFTKKTTKYSTIRGKSKTSKTFSKLKNKKKYYVRVRTYKKVNGKLVYSKWSKVKTVKTK